MQSCVCGLTDAVPNEHAATSETSLRVASRVRNDQTHEDSIAATVACQYVDGKEFASSGALRQKPKQERSKERAADGDGDEIRSPSLEFHCNEWRC